MCDATTLLHVFAHLQFMSNDGSTVRQRLGHFPFLTVIVVFGQGIPNSKGFLVSFRKCWNRVCYDPLKFCIFRTWIKSNQISDLIHTKSHQIKPNQIKSNQIINQDMNQIKSNHESGHESNQIKSVIWFDSWLIWFIKKMMNQITLIHNTVGADVIDIDQC